MEIQCVLGKGPKEYKKWCLTTMGGSSHGRINKISFSPTLWTGISLSVMRIVSTPNFEVLGPVGHLAQRLQTFGL